MFADMPLDNRTVVQIAAVAALFGCKPPPEHHHHQTKRSNISSWMIVL
jgi:hypothetical protein